MCSRYVSLSLDVSLFRPVPGSYSCHHCFVQPIAMRNRSGGSKLQELWGNQAHFEIVSLIHDVSFTLSCPLPLFALLLPSSAAFIFIFSSLCARSPLRGPLTLPSSGTARRYSCWSLTSRTRTRSCPMTFKQRALSTSASFQVCPALWPCPSLWPCPLFLLLSPCPCALPILSFDCG